MSERGLESFVRIDPDVVGDDIEEHSSFRLLLRDARVVSGRNHASGELISECDPVAKWLAAVGWLVFFDLVGGAVTRTDVDQSTKTRTNSHGGGAEDTFRSALVLFADGADLDDDEIGVLWALRCSLAHDYSLRNFAKRSDLEHRFCLISEAGNGLMLLPKPDRDSLTIVNLVALGDLGEAVARGVWKAHEAGVLAMREPDRFADLYFMRQWPGGGPAF